MSETDLELLARYAREQSQEAFTEIVRRHVDLVYSAALRRVRSPHLAQEVAQAVFVKLATGAGRLRRETVLAAWLYQVTRGEAVDLVRREARRQVREKVATEMNLIQSEPDSWNTIEPLLDEAMDALNEADRAIVLLRYFENKSLREVGERLGTSEDAAQKRVRKAVERLRVFFVRRGVPITASSLALLVAANAVQAAPGALPSAIINAAALTGATSLTASTLTKGILVMTFKYKLCLGTAAVLLLLGGAAAIHLHFMHVNQHPNVFWYSEETQPASNADVLISTGPTSNIVPRLEKRLIRLNGSAVTKE